jgi:predicted SnoaL-like aldol condensation-catalyzing enzyme
MTLGRTAHTDRFPVNHEGIAMTETEHHNKALVLEAFDTLFNKRDYAAAHRFWSPDYIQHSAHIQPGREGLFGLVKAAPSDMRYENALITASGDYVMLHGRFWNVGQPANWIVADIVRIEDGLLAEHWDVIQDEATADESQSGLPDIRRHLPHPGLKSRTAERPPSSSVNRLTWRGVRRAQCGARCFGVSLLLIRRTHR